MLCKVLLAIGECDLTFSEKNRADEGVPQGDTICRPHSFGELPTLFQKPVKQIGVFIRLFFVKRRICQRDDEKMRKFHVFMKNFSIIYTFQVIHS